MGQETEGMGHYGLCEHVYVFLGWIPVNQCWSLK